MINIELGFGVECGFGARVLGFRSGAGCGRGQDQLFCCAALTVHRVVLGFSF